MVSYVICKRDSKWYSIGGQGSVDPKFRQVYIQILPDGVQPIRSRCNEIAQRFGIKLVWIGEMGNYSPGDFGLYRLEIHARAWCLERGAKPSQIFIEDTPPFDDKFHGGKTLSEREALLN